MSLFLARNGPPAMSAVWSLTGSGLNRLTQHFILEVKKMECGMERRFHRGVTPAAEKTELRWGPPEARGSL